MDPWVPPGITQLFLPGLQKFVVHQTTTLRWIARFHGRACTGRRQSLLRGRHKCVLRAQVGQYQRPEPLVSASFSERALE
jgi:hypothetical protein